MWPRAKFRSKMLVEGITCRRNTSRRKVYTSEYLPKNSFVIRLRKFAFSWNISVYSHVKLKFIRLTKSQNIAAGWDKAYRRAYRVFQNYFIHFVSLVHIKLWNLNCFPGRDTFFPGRLLHRDPLEYFKYAKITSTIN